MDFLKMRKFLKRYWRVFQSDGQHSGHCRQIARIENGHPVHLFGPAVVLFIDCSGDKIKVVAGDTKSTALVK